MSWKMKRKVLRVTLMIENWIPICLVLLCEFVCLQCQDEEDEDEEEDDNDDDESDTHDEEDEDVDMEMAYEVSDNRQMTPQTDTSV